MSADRLVLRIAPPNASDVPGLAEWARRRGFGVCLPEAVDLPPGFEGGSVYRSDAERIRGPGLDADGSPIHRVRDAAELQTLLRGIVPGATLVVAWEGDRVIPLENLVAATHGRARLWTVARSATEVPASLGALEHGADRVLLSVDSRDAIEAAEHVLDRVALPPLEWAELRIVAQQPAGVGDRVLVDTTSLLRPDEGLLVGSAAAFLFHVASEATGSNFSRPRPFRVNAGSAHSYVLMADGSTRYLSELNAGDAVLATTVGGDRRPVRVGRVKIERRPMVQVAADDPPHRRTVFLQEAETVRLSTDRGPVATTGPLVGRRGHGVRLAPARHLGRTVTETIEER